MYKSIILFLFFVISVSLSACSSSNSKKSYTYTPTYYDNDSYCYNGGRSSKYSCNPELAQPQPNMHKKEIDEIWMYMTLVDIKAWLKEQRLLTEQQEASPPLKVIDSSK